MKVWNRINARRVVLSYFYQRCFFHNLQKQNKIMSEVLEVQNIFPSQTQEFDQWKAELLQKFQDELAISNDENYDYFVRVFFDKRGIDEIDMDYVVKVWWLYEKYLPEVVDTINKYTQTFTFQEMNSISQSLFILWYIERKVLDTPKEVILNELIELAKRYDDDWAQKLINWIMHKIFNNIE